jgi:SPP1 gp7 family putative phage head morphogenesis protein
MLEPFLEGWSANEVKAVGEVVAKGYINGLTTQQIKQSIRGTKAASYTDGIISRLGRNTDAVVKTSIQHVANTARQETWARNSDVVTGYRIIATLDSNTTAICRSLDRKEFKLGQGPMPPFHIRCRSTTVAVMAEEFQFLEEGATRSAVGGPVDAKQTYYDWLGGQSKEFQDDAIGPARAALFRDGGLSSEEFARLNLGRNFQPMTLDQMRKKEPAAFKKAGL